MVLCPLRYYGCSKRQSERTFLKVAKNRTAFFKEIMANPDFIQEFMEHMHENENVVWMIQEIRRIMIHMMKVQGMQTMKSNM